MQLHLKKLNINQIILLCCIICVIFASEVAWLNYFEEILALFFIYKLIIKAKVLPTIVKKITISLFIIILLGFLSNSIFKIQNNFFAMVVDAFGIVKNHLILFGMIFCIKDSSKDKVLYDISNIAKLYIIVCFTCGVANLFVNMGWTYDVRYGIRSFTFIFLNPGSLRYSMLACIAFLSKDKNKCIYQILALIVLAMTLRALALADIACFVVISLIISKKNTSLKFRDIFIIVISILLASWSMVSYYFIDNSSTPRAVLLLNGIRIGNKYFPFGSGLATYGSDMSAKFYSPLYSEYGMSNLWGFMKNEPRFLNDNYWPMVIAQFGYFGLLLNIVIFAMEFKLINNLSRKSESYKEILLLFFALITSTFASAQMTGIGGAVLMIALGLVIRIKQRTILV